MRFDKLRVRRELRRIYLQLRLWPDAWAGARRKARHDREKPFRITEGAQGPQADVAIFLLYQPKGLLASTFATCRHLTEQGFAVIAISNLPLSDQDRAGLAEVSHRVIERPNFGYDFGGYRDGVLHVLESGKIPDNLLILNDSIWFPVLRNDAFLDRLRAQEADLYGPILHKGHLQSYMFSFKARVTASAHFRDYWQNLGLTDNKVGVVRNCEMKMTAQIAAGGFSLDPLASSDDMTAAITALPEEDLAAILRYDQENDTSLGRGLKGLALQGPGWAETARARVAALTGKRYLLKDQPDLLLQALQLPILKKDRAPQYARQRQALTQSTLRDQVSAEVLGEVATWDHR